jgi:hypothetical protein
LTRIFTPPPRPAVLLPMREWQSTRHACHRWHHSRLAALLVLAADPLH